MQLQLLQLCTRNYQLGKTVAQAVAITYQELLKKQARDWHLLRLYVAETLPGALVKRGRKPVPRISVAPEF